MYEKDAEIIIVIITETKIDYMIRRDSMSHHKQETKAIDSVDELKSVNKRRIEELLKINNRYVRTQRHLEENSDIARLDQIKHSLELQDERMARMENLKNIIAYGRHEEVDEKKNLKRKLEFTAHYLSHHRDHIDESTLRNTELKQEHRKEQLSFID